MAVLRANRTIEDQLSQEQKASKRETARANRAEGVLVLIVVLAVFLFVVWFVGTIGQGISLADCNSGGYSQLVVVHGIPCCARIEEGVPVLVLLEVVRERLEER